jgi:hypothetical protein
MTGAFAVGCVVSGMLIAVLLAGSGLVAAALLAAGSAAALLHVRG